MNTVTREQLSRDSQWGKVPDDVTHAIYGPSGRLYDIYRDRATALRVLHDIAKRYGDGYTVVEVVGALD